MGLLILFQYWFSLNISTTNEGSINKLILELSILFFDFKQSKISQILLMNIKPRVLIRLETKLAQLSFVSLYSTMTLKKTELW
jgi:hypothetical protein